MGLDYRHSTELGKTETPLLEGAHKVSCALGPRAKAVNSQEPGPDLPAGLGLLGRWGVALAHSRDEDTGGRGIREYSSA